ncbi:MAG: NAD(P)/FAD-dependent oxidoreductase [Nanoarchaeota archaeon]|nr:NAD(P)/FAD-dependent oxidoreductase [Nanoarchaeota archaeon]MBU1270298.1 NAD(P)/FAD-dependent oxidoreductase [Nanoarchaeota archaeon]MBU1604534.1 NAD(P)/FAD-dependent oxidoreductase [Nanoarchaeota archaeon]MBU2442869.1 NAD(P)/FAD-dependent oxidoreductase [Nanoarchaeota archaeon]
MDSYDVVIVGAGPADLNCARVLAEAKKKVLVLEKNEVVGPKVCAGGLLGHDLEYLKLPDELLDSKFNKEIVHSPFDTDIIKLNYDFIYTVDRKNLGQWLLKRAQTAGAEVRIKSKVTKIENGYVVVNDSEKIGFKTLVGADGSNSFVRLHLGLSKELQLIGIQYIIPTNKYKDIEFFFDSKLFHSWYAWIFPHKGYVSIGCGCDPKKFSSKKIMANFKKWLEINKIDVSKGRYESFPINADYKGYQFKNVFLVGDAAGLASIWTGEGIYQALISGEEVAKVILDKKCVPAKLNDVIKHKKLHNRIVKILELSGPVRRAEYELMLLLFKSKKMDEKFIDLIA